MKNAIVKAVWFCLISYVLLAFSSCGQPQSSSESVDYLPTESYVTEARESVVRCSVCLQNNAEKSLTFCVYGVFQNNERALGLDENLRLKTVTLRPYEKRSDDFVFRIDSQNPPNDIIIIGQYNETGR